MSSSDPHDVKWGYNLADLNRITRAAVNRSRCQWDDYTERYEAAWLGIAEDLCAANTRPDPSQLLDAGMLAVAHHGAQWRHARGYAHTGGVSRRAATYWQPVDLEPVTDRVVDSLALWQVWHRLSGRDREALLLLATHGDRDTAATASRWTPGSYRVYLNRARWAFACAWWAPETPRKRPPDHGISTAPMRWHGRRRITVSQLAQIRARYHAGESQTALAAEYASTSSTVSKLLRGVSRPGPDAVT